MLTMRAAVQALRGQGVASRFIKGSSITAVSFGLTQALRLGSNLILTRILFPEAFGLMALVTVFLVGLAMFSDTGVAPAIMRSPRGDEQEFLDTAWSIQILRGVLLWVVTAALALPVSWLYDEPLLAQLLPVAGFSLFIAGFNPTRMDSAFRHMRVFRVTVLDLIGQAVGVVATILLALWLQSVWGLVFGAIIAALTKLALLDRYLDGPRNRFRINRTDMWELLHFGKWIFLGSISGFLVVQGDKAVLGVYLSLAALGIYNIGYFIGSFPAQLADTVMMKFLIPLYREMPPRESAENARKVSQLRFVFSGAILVCLGVFGCLGPFLIDLLYDDRYRDAGGVVVLIACAFLIALPGRTYDQVALAGGDSRGFFIVVTIRAVLQTAFLWAGAHFFGLVGALAGQAAALALAYVPTVFLARKHDAWDPLHDVVIGVLALLTAAGALWLSQDAVMALVSGIGP